MSEREVLYRGFVTVERDGESGFEIVRATDSIAFLVYVRDRDEVLFVRQRRPAMVGPANPSGQLLEAPAGRFDRALGPRALAVAEAWEEVGVRADEAAVRLLNGGVPVALSPGVLTERVYLAWLEVEAAAVEAGEGLYGEASEGERIERVFVPRRDLGAMVFDNVVTMALVQWFLSDRGEGGHDAQR